MGVFFMFLGWRGSGYHFLRKSMNDWYFEFLSVREKPGLGLGSTTPKAALCCFTAPLRLMRRTDVFQEPTKGYLQVSPLDYCLQFDGGGLDKEVDNQVKWDSHAVLWFAMRCWVWELPEEGPGSRLNWFGPNSDPVSHPFFTLAFVETGVLAIRTQAGLRYQLYEDGWPICAPQLLPEYSGPFSLVLAARVSNRWFTDLPFTQASVKSALMMQQASRFVSVTWHDTPILTGLHTTSGSPACYDISSLFTR